MAAAQRIINLPSMGSTTVIFLPGKLFDAACRQKLVKKPIIQTFFHGAQSAAFIQLRIAYPGNTIRSRIKETPAIWQVCPTSASSSSCPPLPSGIQRQVMRDNGVGIIVLLPEDAELGLALPARPLLVGQHDEHLDL